MSRCKLCKGQTYWIHPNDPDNCGCEPEMETRLDLRDLDYEYLEVDQAWRKVISYAQRVARKDHKSGEVMKGERYTEIVERLICDLTSNQHVERTIRRGW